jgi:hypothetical protein
MESTLFAGIAILAAFGLNGCAAGSGQNPTSPKALAVQIQPKKTAGDGMWRAEVAAGDVALLRVSPASFSDGGAAVSPSDYLSLPKVEGYDFQNRFVGDYLLYGRGSGWGYPNTPAMTSAALPV